MSKQEFLDGLRAELQKASIANIDNMVEYYDEMICDRIEDGMSEEAAVADVDSIEEIVNNAMLDKPVTALVKERVVKSREKAKSNGTQVLWIVLAVLGFPVWFPIGIALLAIVFSLYVAIWAVVISIFAVLLALVVAGLACLAAPFIAIFAGGFTAASTVASIGVAFLLFGIVALLWKPIVALAKSCCDAVVKLGKSIKKAIIKK